MPSFNLTARLRLPSPRAFAALSLLSFTVFAAPPVAAQTFGDIFTDMRTSQLGPAADILGTISFVLGVAFGIMAVMAMIRRSRTTNDNSVEVGRILMLSLAAACMIAIPTFLNVGVASIFGTGADQSTVDGQLRSLN